MEADKEGFVYPSVNTEVCIDCKLCEKVCPVINREKEDKPHRQYGYLVQHKDEKIRKQSTSGGAFTAIASWVINQGGVVFGAGYKKGTFTVAHQPVERTEELAIFRNSKYVQSELGECFSQVKCFLDSERLVLFSGTPCQIEGLVAYLRNKKYKNLLLVDIVCHGIPSPRVFSSYLKAQEELIGGKFTNVLFRDKYYGYHYSSFSIYNTDSSKNYHKGVDTNGYLRAFFRNLSDRPSCYACPFKKRYRKSDLTLWDCFPIEKFTKKLDGKGTTRVLVQSEKGAEVMNEAIKDLNYEEVDPDKLTEGVREMFHSVPMNPKREAFFEDLDRMASVEFFNKWFPLTWQVRLNSLVRITCHKLGIYTLAKRFFLLFYTKRDARLSRKHI
jgi:coenzyme F420-reducing hydrogenase beta subunit